MTDERAVPTEPASPGEEPLTRISRSDFIAGWTALVGEPPAAMLDSRAEMIRTLVESTPVAPPTPQGDPRQAPPPQTPSPQTPLPRAEVDPADESGS